MYRGDGVCTVIFAFQCAFNNDFTVDTNWGFIDLRDGATFLGPQNLSSANFINSSHVLAGSLKARMRDKSVYSGPDPQNLPGSITPIIDGTVIVNGVTNWGLERRLGTSFSKTDATLANVTGISSLIVYANRPIAFEAWLPCSVGSSAVGVQAAITCTSTTITAISYSGYV